MSSSLSSSCTSAPLPPSSAAFCTVTSLQAAFNILVSDSIVVLDCREGGAELTGAVRVKGRDSAALLAAYSMCMSELCPDNPRVVLVVADEASDGLRAAAEALRARCTRCLLVAGFDRAFPFLFGTTTLPLYPNQISDNLFLGSAFMLAKESLLDELKITHVLSVIDRHIPVPFGRKHLCVDIVDSMDADLRPVLKKAIPFLEEASKGRVFVHCEQGVSRSVSVVVAFLMLRHNMTLPAALAHVRASRPGARPNENFMHQLKLLEVESAAFYEGIEAKKTKLSPG